jgi:hypothetical protein
LRLTKGVIGPTNTCFQTKQLELSKRKQEMIKPLNAPQLSSMKTRCGLQKVSELLPRLIRQYEIQAELMKQRSQSTVPAMAPTIDRPAEQATFSWYE